MFDDWVPKKLEFALTFDNEDLSLALNAFKSVANCQVQPGEESLPEDAGADVEEEPELNMEMVKQLIEMGIPENQAKHSVYRTNQVSADMALAWFYENIENPDIQGPLRVKKAGAASGNEPPAESIAMIEAMGFTQKQARRALRKCDNNVERACDWMFSHMDEPDSADEM